MKKRIVIALGGNALQKKGEATAEAQKAVAAQVGDAIAELADKYEIVITHGNGPQVGNILLHQEQAATKAAPAMPLETAVAMSEGQIGYWLSQALKNAFSKRGKRKSVISVVTQVVVDPYDPAFRRPTKPIGQFYTAKEALTLSKRKGWVMKEDAGRGYRRVVPSPKPQDIVEATEIKALIDAGIIVIAAGGGGIPVTRSKVLHILKGVDAVIDKDFASAKLAELIDADIFVSVTAVPYAYLNFGKPTETPLEKITPEEADGYIKAGYFKAGSMLPKISAVSSFAKKAGKTGIITSIDNLSAALQGKSGTIIKKQG